MRVGGGVAGAQAGLVLPVGRQGSVVVDGVCSGQFGPPSEGCGEGGPSCCHGWRATLGGGPRRVFENVLGQRASETPLGGDCGKVRSGERWAASWCSRSRSAGGSAPDGTDPDEEFSWFIGEPECEGVPRGTIHDQVDEKAVRPACFRSISEETGLCSVCVWGAAFATFSTTASGRDEVLFDAVGGTRVRVSDRAPVKEE